MNKIIHKRQLSDNVFRLDVEAPIIARERKAGQFIILMVDDKLGERIPLTIGDADPVAGTITLIFQTVGATTMKLSKLNEGDYIAAVLGPLGSPTPSAARTASPRAMSCASAAASVSRPCIPSRRRSRRPATR
jgi:ferredoxin--NADP+ reductase